MSNEKYNYLVPDVSDTLIETFMFTLLAKPQFRHDAESGTGVDASPFLNMTIGVFISALIKMLDKIKESTDGEESLMKNIDLTKISIIKTFENLPFIDEVILS